MLCEDVKQFLHLNVDFFPILVEVSCSECRGSVIHNKTNVFDSLSKAKHEMFVNLGGEANHCDISRAFIFHCNVEHGSFDSIHFVPLKAIDNRWTFGTSKIVTSFNSPKSKHFNKLFKSMNRIRSITKYQLSCSHWCRQ